MALVRCPSCNKKISNAATSCPGCGEPRPDGGWKKPSAGPFGWVLALIIGIGIMSGQCGTDNNTTTAPLAPSKKTETVMNSAWDGSVWQVEHYLKRRLKDPDSFEAMEWGKVILVPGGTYQARCLYRAKNSFGGYVVEQVLVDLDRDGNVTNMVALP